MNKKTLSVGLIVFSLFVVALITRSGDIAWMTLPFLAILAAGVLGAPVLEKLHLSASRTLEHSRQDGRPSVDVRLSVHNGSAEAVCLTIDEKPQPGMKLLHGDLARTLALQAGESAELKYSFTALRGDFSWESARAVVSDPLGLVATEISLPAGGSIQVRPQGRKFKAITFRPWSTLPSPGPVPARLGGSGTDFFGVREYHPGDPLRWLDWRLTARHPRRYFTKEFEQEHTADIGLVLDARPRTDFRLGEDSLFEHSVGAAASLAEMFLHQGHRLSLVVFGGTLLNAFPGYGKGQLHRIMGVLSAAHVQAETSTSMPLGMLPMSIFPSHALMIVITSLSQSDDTFFQRLRASGYQVLLISPDPFAYASPLLGKAKDPADGLALRAARLERLIRLNEIARMKIPVIDWQVDAPLFPLVRSALSRSRGERER